MLTVSREEQGIYLHKDAISAVSALHRELRPGWIPGEIYLDNGNSSSPKHSKLKLYKNGITLIFGLLYNPPGRDKIERYHRTLYQEYICLREFQSLSRFRCKRWNFDQQYNYWRTQEILGWMIPTSVYPNEFKFNKDRKHIQSGQKLRQQNGQ